MRNEIRKYMEGLFEQAPSTAKAYELKEEMIQNLTEKYDDLISEGKPPEAAYNIAVGGIGDINELFTDLEDSIMKPIIDPQAQKKSAMLTAIAVMMYILSPVPAIIFDNFYGRGWGSLSAILFFFMIAGATGLLIYNNMTKPRYHKSDDTVVEEFREFQSRKTGKNHMYGAINGAMWSLIVALYFIISFTVGAWHITWVIFLIGGAVSSLLRIFITTRD